MLTKAKVHLPSVLQNESHPYLQEKDLRDFCAANDIVFQVIESQVGTLLSRVVKAINNLHSD